MTQRGSAPILLVVIASVFGLGLIASLYLNYMQLQYNDQDRKQLQGQITDLQYELKQHQASPSPSGSPSSSPSASPSPTPAVLGVQVITISQLGVKLTAGDPISDLTYSYEPVGNLAVANLTTTSLVAKYPACKPGASALGMLVRRPLNSKPTSSASKLIKTLGQYNYYYVSPSGNCGSGAAGQAAVTAARAALTNTVLPTLAN